MKNKLRSLTIGLALLAGVPAVLAQTPVITSFSQNGVLTYSNASPGTTMTVAWASSLAGPWQTNWASLTTLTVGANGTGQVSVPMFYRVFAVTNFINTPAGIMRLIPAGSFTMGDTLDGESDAIPTNVYVSAFYMDTKLVTSNQWATVYTYATANGYNFDHAGSGKAGNDPVQSVNWYDCVKWCNARSQQEGLTPVYFTNANMLPKQMYTTGDFDAVYANWSANGYRLPTEAEWEKAARGGLSGQRFPWGNTISESQANYYGYPSGISYDWGPNGFNAIGDGGVDDGNYPYTSPVGSFAANGYGLYDMAGNVFEWCWDWYGTPYGQPTPANPTGSAGSADFSRVTRGGYWASLASQVRCANRYSLTPDVANVHFGFRCVRGL